eukprot:TRINITY_DN8681_c0_g1_i1.p1 TRINITY_DN8681_c0_g1~~TRINITY_DN8681_c0_g1_i1.p1  ORF type:complete len:312 (-),score=76.79 TRINITY_DN8681_c0_g1_i1:81-1016(-)
MLPLTRSLTVSTTTAIPSFSATASPGAQHRRSFTVSLPSHLALSYEHLPPSSPPPKSPSPAPVMYLHGLFGSSKNWGGIAKLVGRESILVDLRNHGDSPHDEDMTVPTMAADVIELIQSLNLPPITLLGHSMGGKVAMSVAEQRPDLLQKLLIVDVSPGQSNSSKQELADIVAALRSLPIDELPNRVAADAALKASIPEQFIRSFLLQNLKNVKGGGSSLAWRVPLEFIDTNLFPMMEYEFLDRSKYEGPSLFIGGANSGYLSDEATQEHTKRIFPQSSLQMIEGAGHYPHFETRDEFLGIVNQFLQSEEE